MGGGAPRAGTANASAAATARAMVARIGGEANEAPRAVCQQPGALNARGAAVAAPPCRSASPRRYFLHFTVELAVSVVPSSKVKFPAKGQLFLQVVGASM